MNVRVAFAGASGTGKSTLAEYLKGELGLPFNPVGSRSVSKEMGFATPYDVDKAGKRAEFQHRLAQSKCDWEASHEAFVTDRTTLDNLTYTMLHDIYAASDDTLIARIERGLQSYTHIIYCPVDVFCSPGDDPDRVKSMSYHMLYDVALRGLLLKFLPWSENHLVNGAYDQERVGPVFGVLRETDLEARKKWALDFVRT